MILLITGINGFIGRSLQANFLQAGHKLIGVEKSDNFSTNNIKQYTWEELNEIDKVECIIHLAGLAHDTSNTKTMNDYYKVNTELTKIIFQFFLTSSATTFIFLSTVKAVTDFSENPLIEGTHPSPSSIYGKTKLMAEEYIMNHIPKDGRRVYILRPSLIHGPNLKGNLLSLYKFIKKGLPYPFGNLSNTRSFLSINNLNFIMEKLIVGNIESGIYNLADDQPLSTTRIVELICETLHKKPFIISLPRWLIDNLANLGTTLHVPVNNETIKKMTGNFLVSNEKIRKALNISSLPVSAEEGLRHTLKNIS